jgi:peptidoglycan/LPS O-acetylase OafA/YrhL
MHWYWFGFTRFHILTISLLIMTPLSVAFGWVFFRVFERPFMTSVAAKRAAKPKQTFVDQEALAREVA